MRGFPYLLGLTFCWRGCFELELKLVWFRHHQLDTQLMNLIDDFVWSRGLRTYLQHSLALRLLHNKEGRFSSVSVKHSVLVASWLEEPWCLDTLPNGRKFSI